MCPLTIIWKSSVQSKQIYLQFDFQFGILNHHNNNLADLDSAAMTNPLSVQINLICFVIDLTAFWISWELKYYQYSFCDCLAGFGYFFP